MSQLRFDGRVAVVTGAGRGIGRAHARLLAARGAAVVVNDLGGSIAGDGADVAPAAAVVDGIVAAGGQAIADAHDVSDPVAAQAIVDAAVDAFGRIDIVVNNAGIVRWAKVSDVTPEDLDAHLAVHVAGSFNTVRAAWPRFVEQGHGRIVLTGSSGMFGLPTNLAYASAKAAMIGMANSLAVAGGRHGIKVNVIAPAAMTRMAVAEGEPTVDASDPMAPELVAPMVAYLAHDDCPVSGEVFAAGAGRFTRIVVAETSGHVHAAVDPPTIDDVAAHWDEIVDETHLTVPADLPSWSARFLRHLGTD